MANRISTLFDLDVKGFRAGIAQMKTDIGNADGLVAKFKVGAAGLGNSLGSFLQSGPGIAAIGAGIGAAGKFALDAVSDFSALGVEIGQLSDATGLTTEAASRWKEVAGDIGIESGTLETGLGKLNKTIGLTPGLFADAGIEIAKTKDGAVDVNGTFLNVIQRLKGMQDPAKKAALAAKLLGKGWQGMSELIEQGSGTLTKSLSEVADAKVFDEEKIAKAREFRKATDELSDVMEEFTITMGTELAPALSDVAGVAADLLGVWGKLFGGTKNLILGAKEWVLSVADGNSVTKEAIINQNDLGTALGGIGAENRAVYDSWRAVSDAESEATDAADENKRHNESLARDVQVGLDRIKNKWKEVQGTLSDEEAWLSLQSEFDEVKAKFEEAAVVGDKSAGEIEQGLRDAATAMAGLRSDVIDYGVDVLGLPDEKMTRIFAAVNPESLAEAEALIANLTRNRDFSLGIISRGGAGYASLSGAQASGTTNAPRGLNLVGERGPELVNFGGGETVYNAGDTSRMMGSVAPIVINVHGTVIQERDLARTVAAAIIDGQRRGAILPWAS